MSDCSGTLCNQDGQKRKKPGRGLITRVIAKGLGKD